MRKGTKERVLKRNAQKNTHFSHSNAYTTVSIFCFRLTVLVSFDPAKFVVRFFFSFLFMKLRKYFYCLFYLVTLGVVVISVAASLFRNCSSFSGVGSCLLFRQCNYILWIRLLHTVVISIPNQKIWKCDDIFQGLNKYCYSEFHR